MLLLPPLKIWVAGFWICLFNLPLPGARRERKHQASSVRQAGPLRKTRPALIGWGSESLPWLANPKALRGETRSVRRSRTPAWRPLLWSVSPHFHCPLPSEWAPAVRARPAAGCWGGRVRGAASASAGAELRALGLPGRAGCPLLVSALGFPAPSIANLVSEEPLLVLKTPDLSHTIVIKLGEVGRALSTEISIPLQEFPSYCDWVQDERVEL